jgi:dipicolinate synthase subunit B
MDDINLNGIKIGYAVCGSFCTFEKAFLAAKKLIDYGAVLTPIMSFNACSLNTRFGTAQENKQKLETICSSKAICTIEDAEPIGPKNMFDILIVSPCTGNTIAKLANGIIDTPVTMAAKSHIRNHKPIVIALSTNDALAGAAKNIGILLNYKNYFFVPFTQDDSTNKPRSLSADFSKIPEAAAYALKYIQIQPLIF